MRFWGAEDPRHIDRYIREQYLDHVSVPARRLCCASGGAPGRKYLDALKAIAEENGAETISDHLGFTRDGHNGVEMGHFAPPPFTMAALDVTCRNIDLIQKHFGDI